MDEMRRAAEEYFIEWNDWISRSNGFAFGNLKPMHLGWKVKDEQALGQKMSALLSYITEGHIGTVDNRKIALLVPKKAVANVPVLQIMQLRPGATDALGLDHLAFYCSDMPALEQALKSSDYQWEHQSNPGHTWISLWFGDKKREAKFFDHTSLDLGARELMKTSGAIKST